jgi:hypothetical protein
VKSLNKLTLPSNFRGLDKCRMQYRCVRSAFCLEHDYANLLDWSESEIFCWSHAPHSLIPLLAGPASEVSIDDPIRASSLSNG